METLAAPLTAPDEPPHGACHPGTAPVLMATEPAS
jgi:hypothetical protein